ncbi:unnamed protein product [Scytosiphon promiscuus]
MTSGSGAKLLPRHHDEFRSKDYWDTFFQQRTDAFEWYGEYDDLRKLVHQTLRRADRILVIGCGNSNFSAELYDDGFESVENVDFSEPVVAEMNRLHSGVRQKMTWRVMDVTDMSGYEDGSFDAVVDKGTLDALMSEDTPEVMESGEAMLREVKRVLNPGGRYMCVTLWQDFIGSAFLASFGSPNAAASSGANPRHVPWTLDLHSAAAASKPSPYLPVCLVAAKPLSVCGGQDGEEVGKGTSDSNDEEGGDGARVVARCDRAGRPLPPGGEPFILSGETQVLMHVREAQQMHRRRFDLREIRPGRFEQEDLWGVAKGGRESPRFTLLIVDVSTVGQASTAVPCAVVLIPRGRDRDFTFASREGLEQVARSANTRRLIAVRLNRGHDFSNGVEGVKTEISPSISEFAPEASGADTGGLGIPIMAVSDGLGVEGRVVAEGCLKCSGDFVVEEEEDEDDADGRPAGVYRRLIFLKNEGVVQTEVRLLEEDEDDGARPPPSASSRKASKAGGGKKGKGKGKAGKAARKTPASSAGMSRSVVAGSRHGSLVPTADESCLVSLTVLLCPYLYLSRCMVAGAALADFRVASSSSGQRQDSRADTTRASTALVIGLGGGALPMALRSMYPRLRVATVELDPEMAGIAKEHFGLRESSDGLKVWLMACGVSCVEKKPRNLLGSHALNASVIDCSVTQLIRLTVPRRVRPSSAAAIASEPPQTPPADAGVTPAPVVLPPSPPGEDQTEWGQAFGPPYSAIFLDVDSKDTSVGMSCPPAAFLEPAFLNNLKALLQGGGSGGGKGGGGEGGPGVLAINVAARSKELFGNAMTAVCAAFTGGEVHKVRASEDDVNSVVLALPRPRGRARSGPLSTVAEQALSSATVSKKALASILEVCERAEAVQVTPVAKPKSKTGGGGKNAKNKRSGR